MAVIVQSNAGFKCFGAARDAFYCHDPEWLLSGPYETGKTYTALMKLHLLACIYPKSRWLMLRKTYNSLVNSAVVTYEKKVLPVDPDDPDSAVRKFGGERPEHYDYPNGSRIVVAGLDNPTKALSSEYDGIYVNQAEELSLEDWETLSSRASGRAGNTPYPQLFGDCNPGPPNHWILKRQRLHVFYSKHEDNPSLFDHAANQWTPRGLKTLETLDALTGVRLKRGRFGLWVSAEGQVYENFDPALHAIDPFNIPKDWRRIRAIDFGFNNPFVCSWYALDHDDVMYHYREIYQTGRIVSEFAKDIIRLSAGENIEATVADHDSEDRATLNASGVSTILARKEISPGIQAVQDRLKKRQNGKAGIYFFKNALVEVDSALLNAHKPTCTLDEFPVYVWPIAKDGKPIKESPVDLDNHGMDTTRYAVRYADNPNVLRVESAPDYLTKRY